MTKSQQAKAQIEEIRKLTVTYTTTERELADSEQKTQDLRGQLELDELTLMKALIKVDLLGYLKVRTDTLEKDLF